eukprot:scaffold5495_cov39-Phaeocystis_antarctica.AAC.2
MTLGTILATHAAPASPLLVPLNSTMTLGTVLATPAAPPRSAATLGVTGFSPIVPSPIPSRP